MPPLAARRPWPPRQRPHPSVVVRTSALLTSVFLFSTSSGLFGTVVGIRTETDRFGSSGTALVLAAFYAGFMIGSVWAPRLVGTVGHIRVFAGFTSLAAATHLSFALESNTLLWVGLRLVAGASIAALYVVAETWLTGLAGAEDRGRLLAVYMLLVTTGSLLGQVLVTAADPRTFRLFSVAAILVSLAAVPVALVNQQAPEIDVTVSFSARRLVRLAPLAPLTSAGAGFLTGALLGYGPVYAASVGRGSGGVARFMAAMLVGAIVVQIPLGQLSDRVRDRRSVIAGVAAVGTLVAATAGPGMDPGGPGLVGAAAALGALAFPLYALAVAHLNDYLDPGSIVGAGSRVVLFNGVGAVAGPGLVALAGPDRFFDALAVGFAVVGSYALYRQLRRSPVEEAERARFVAIGPAPTPVIAALEETVALEPAEPQDHNKEFPDRQVVGRATKEETP